MKIKGNFALILGAVVSFGIAIVIGGIVMPNYYESKKDVIKIIQLNKEYLTGKQIDEKDLVEVEVGKFNLPNNVIKLEDKKNIVNKYAKYNLKPGRYLYSDDFQEKKPTNELKYKTTSGLVTVKTDLAKSVGGIIKDGDYVEVHIITKGDGQGSMNDTLYPELAKVKVASIVADNGQAMGGHEASNQSNGENLQKPAFITFDTENFEQKRRIIEGNYNGEIHLALLNPEAIGVQPSTQVETAAIAPPPVKENSPSVQTKSSNNDEQNKSNNESGGGGFSIQ